MPSKESIHDFFEKPESVGAKAVQFLIFLLILLSLNNLVFEFRYPDVHAEHALWFHLAELLILAVFTIEYVLRLATAPQKWKWVRKPMNIIDFLAVFPSYLEFILPLFINTSSVRAIRIIRVLKFSKVLRAFKLFKFGNLFAKVMRYERTILQAITPVIGMFVCSKAIIWILEINELWIADPNLGELFAIIGFALGIILSQKIGVTYDKFLQVEEATVRIYGTLRSLQLILDKVEPKLGTKACKKWADAFLHLLESPQADNNKINAVNDELYDAMSKAEPTPGEIAMLHGEICRDSAFCLSKKVRLTPKAYDTLLHQATILYLIMIIVFLPGFTGMISVMVAAYILYGMYNLTEDLDTILGGEFNLIDIDISEIRHFVREEA